EPRWLPSSDHTFAWDNGTGDGMSPSRRDALAGVQRVKTDGPRAVRHFGCCILCNELIDNFPVPRFAIQGGRVKEVFVTSTGGHLTEVLDEPSSPRLEERLTSLGLSLTEGYRGEVNLAMEDWTGQLSKALDRGFILTIDYGQLATDLYSFQNHQGTLVCYHRHVVSSDPYQNIGQQDITCQVDFTSLMRLGDRHGLATVGYALQSQFLTNLGFSSFLNALQTQSLSAARMALSRMAMMTLIDPEEYGDFNPPFKGSECPCRFLGLRGLHTMRRRGPMRHRPAGDEVGPQRTAQPLAHLSI